MENIKIIVGNNIKRLRAENKITASDLANVLGVSAVSISSWELGKALPRATAIDKICSYFKVSKNELITDITVKSNLLINLDLINTSNVSYKGRLLTNKEIEKINILLGVLFDE